METTVKTLDRQYLKESFEAWAKQNLFSTFWDDAFNCFAAGYRLAVEDTPSYPTVDVKKDYFTRYISSPPGRL